MMDGNNNGDVSNAQIMHSIGKLVGTMEAMNKNVDEIRSDIRRLDQTANDRLVRVEDNLSKQISTQGEVLNRRIDDLEASVGSKVSSLGTRVSALEAEDKKIIENVAKMSALGGGVGGALVTAAVELIKHF
jgi:archaellum component FlaC